MPAASGTSPNSTRSVFHTEATTSSCVVRMSCAVCMSYLLPARRTERRPGYKARPSRHPRRPTPHSKREVEVRSGQVVEHALDVLVLLERVDELEHGRGLVLGEL